MPTCKFQDYEGYGLSMCKKTKEICPYFEPSNAAGSYSISVTECKNYERKREDSAA
jgi:hypothetical protein